MRCSNTRVGRKPQFPYNLSSDRLPETQEELFLSTKPLSSMED